MNHRRISGGKEINKSTKVQIIESIIESDYRKVDNHIMEFLNQEESSSGSRIVANTTEHDVSIDQQYNVDALSPPATTTTQLPNINNVTDHSTARTNSNFTNEEEGGEGNNDDNNDGDEFTASRNRSRFRSFLRYTRAVLALFFAVVLDLTSANNKSILSKIVRIVVTTFTYVTIYTNATGLLFLAMDYLMNHGWYLLTVTSAVMVLFLSGLLLVFYEWMWQWQGRVISYLCDDGSNSNSYTGYNRLRSVTVLDDDDMEDDLTLRGWIKQIVRVLVTCLIWSLSCVGIMKVDFWITDRYVKARPQAYEIEYYLLDGFENAAILLGAALLLYYAYPSFYRLNFCRDRLPSSATLTTSFTGTTTVDTTIDANVSFAFASTEDVDNESYTIEVVDEDDEMTMGVGMQNLII